MQFFRWWRRRLSEALPVLFSDPDHAGADGVTIRSDGSELHLPENIKAGQRIIVEVDPAEVLFNIRDYPFAVLGSVGDLLRAEIEELTPFSAADAAIAYKLDRPDWSQRRYRVKFAVIARNTLRRLFGTIEAAGLTPAGARVGSDGEIFFFPADDSEPVPKSPRVTSVARGLVAVALLFGVAVVPSMKVGEIAEARSLEVDAARSGATQSAAIQARVRAVNESIALLASLRRETLSPLFVLAELSRQMPRDSWLDTFEIDSGRLRIVGFARNPADVVTALSQSALLTEIQYRAAGTRRGASDAERFELTARLSAEGGAE